MIRLKEGIESKLSNESLPRPFERFENKKESFPTPAAAKSKDANSKGNKNHEEDNNDDDSTASNGDEFDHAKKILIKQQILFTRTDYLGNVRTDVDVERFIDIIKITTKDDDDALTEAECQLLFNKIDIHRTGKIGWDAYLEFMLVEHLVKDKDGNMDGLSGLSNQVEMIRSIHHDTVIRICELETCISVNRKMVKEPGRSKYLTLSSDGVLSVYNRNWIMERNANLNGSSERSSSSKKLQSYWLDACVMSNCTTLAVSTDDLKICFFEIKSSSKICEKFRFTHLPASATVMAYLVSPHNYQVSSLMWGDAQGAIFYLRFLINPNHALFARRGPNKGELPIGELMAGKYENIVLEQVAHSFGDGAWVRSLHLTTNAKENEFFMACATTEEDSLICGEVLIENREESGSKQKLHFNQVVAFAKARRATCFDYDSALDLIMSGHTDGVIRLWSAKSPSKITPMSSGHGTPVTEVVLRGQEQKALSISKDLEVRLWSLVDSGCFRKINGLRRDFQHLPITAMQFDPSRNQLVLASNRIGILKQTHLSLYSPLSKKRRSLYGPSSGLLYSTEFNLVISSAIDGGVTVWNLHTGEKTCQLVDQDQQLTETTAIAFDKTHRRVLTGAKDGTISLWNFHNGSKLRTLHKSSDKQINSFIFHGKHIYAAGWDRAITCYEDNDQGRKGNKLPRLHAQDISSTDFHQNDHLMASSSLDGDIFLWNIESGSVLAAFNMCRSILPVFLGSGIQTSSGPEKKMMAFMLPKTARVVGPTVATTASGDIRGDDALYLPAGLAWRERNERASEADEDENEGEGPSGSSVDQVKSTDNKAATTEHEDDTQEASATLNRTDYGVYKILFLQNRKNDGNEASLISGTGCGWVCAWSASLVGGLIGYFQAAFKPADQPAITSLDCADDYSTLVTGDSEGYVRFWDISNYCTVEAVSKQRRKCGMQDKNKPIKTASSLTPKKKLYYPISEPPPLQLTERCHTSPIIGVAVVTPARVFVTSSADCMVRLWSIDGAYLATFGHETWTSIPSLHALSKIEEDRPIVIPHELQAWVYQRNLAMGIVEDDITVKSVLTMSALNLKLTNFGKTLLAIRERMFRKADEDYKEAYQRLGRDEIEEKTTLTIWQDDEPCRLARTPFGFDSDKVEATVQRLTEDARKRGIVKAKKRYPVHKIKFCEDKAMVFGNMNLASVNEPLSMKLPRYFEKKPQKSKRPKI